MSQKADDDRAHIDMQHAQDVPYLRVKQVSHRKKTFRENGLSSHPFHLSKTYKTSLPPEYLLPTQYLHKYLPYSHETHTYSPSRELSPETVLPDTNEQDEGRHINQVSVAKQHSTNGFHRQQV